jgi:hypothetical protein
MSLLTKIKPGTWHHTGPREFAIICLFFDIVHDIDNGFAYDLILAWRIFRITEAIKSSAMQIEDNIRK